MNLKIENLKILKFVRELVGRVNTEYFPNIANYWGNFLLKPLYEKTAKISKFQNSE
jgi:hypothetical protein